MKASTPQINQKHNASTFHNFVLHIHPRTVPESVLRFTHTYGLGGMAFVLFILSALSGILLMLIYEPLPHRAYQSVLILEKNILFGGFIRNIHHWSGNFLLVLAVLHILRVFLSGGYHGPRRFNWIIGSGLFLLILAANFTGYLLPWDQLGFWAVTIMISMLSYIPFAGSWLQNMIRGGAEIGPATLINFYTLHTTMIPVLFIVFLPWHFWRVRRAGGVAQPQDESGANSVRIPAVPGLIIRELAVAMALIAFVLVFSIFVNAPLENMANPGLSPNPAKAPWYFLGIQELLLHFHPLFALCILPAAWIIFFLMIPYVDNATENSGIWFISKKGRRMSIVAAAIAAFMTPLLIILDEFCLDFQILLCGISSWITSGLIPTIIAVAAIIGFYLFMQKTYIATRGETIMALFVLLMIGFSIMTLTCFWFRGKGMGLTWPV
jgi:quinol-cytochrome oxidoreductase complex cytochrome b subunit